MAAGLSLDLLKLGAKPKVAVARPTAAVEAPEAQITVTASAAKAIHEQLAKRDTTTGKSGLRVGVKAGGCSGFEYVFLWEAEPRPDDLVFQASNGVRVWIDPRSHRLLEGTTLDYDTSLLSRGFMFENPHAKSTCGCGTSFSV